MSPRTAVQLEENRKATEQLILKAALKVFSIHGFAGASIRAIAKEAKISDGLLYNYFKSKEDLVFAVMKSSFSTLDSIIVNDESASPET
ncbi:MAG: helix-turn-helix transcriptional regulator, partial [Crocinitomicaceae bacterium]|nr:helix-turn-helix transcriptional regulator [Crocinitomicaceae bacterium]